MLKWLHDRLPHPVRATEDRIKEAIMATRDELLTEIKAIEDQVVKSRGEVVAKIGELEAKLASAQPITLEDLAGLRAEVQTSDDVVPDTDTVIEPVETTPETETPAAEEPAVEVPVEETVTVDEATA